MRAATAIVASLVLVGLSAATLFAYGGGLGGPDGTLTERWVSDTARETTGNHHRPAVARVGGEPLVFVPVNSPREAGDCDLVALDRNGTATWRAEMAPASCNIHGYGTPTTADVDGDGVPEVLVATTEEALYAYDARTGETELSHHLSWWGYTAPIVTDFTGSPGREVVVVDLNGDVLVLGSDGEREWNVTLSTTVAEPDVADFDADGRDELAVGHADGVTLLEPDGSASWETPVEANVNWMASGQADGDDAVEIVVATDAGEVIAVDGRDGSVEWRVDVGEFAAVGAVEDGDGDGQAEVYATARDGKLRAIDGSDGTVEWTTTLTTEDVRITPPPTLGDLDGDGDEEVVAVSLTGEVSVVDPASGAVLATYERDVPIRITPGLADLDGDGGQELLVVYGDGRVVALSYEQHG